MLKQFLKKILLLIPQLLILSFLIFLLPVPVPPDLVGVERFNPMADIPILLRYWNWLVGIFGYGYFGWSWQYGMPVVKVVGQWLPNTFRLAFFTLVMTYGIGIPLGIISGRHSGTWKERVALTIAQMGSSLPAFTLALILILTLGLRFRWFPTSGSITPGMVRENVSFFTYHLTRIRHVILPATSLAIVSLIIPLKQLRSEIVDIERQEFVTLARSKGATEKQIFKGHILKNSFISVIGSFPIQLATIVTGSIIIETLFAFSGIGHLFLMSMYFGDLELTNMLVLVFGLIILTASFISDVWLMLIDPRIRIGK